MTTTYEGFSNVPPLVKGLVNTPLPPLGVNTLNIRQIGAPSPGIPWKITPPISASGYSSVFDENGFSTNEKGLEVGYVTKPLSSGHSQFAAVGSDMFSIVTDYGEPISNDPHCPLLLPLASLNQLLTIGYENSVKMLGLLLEDPEYSDIRFLSEKELFGDRQYDNIITALVEDGVIAEEDTFAPRKRGRSINDDPSGRTTKRKRMLADVMRENQEEKLVLSRTDYNLKAAMLQEDMEFLEKMAPLPRFKGSPSTSTIKGLEEAKLQVLKNLKAERDLSILDDKAFRKSKEFWLKFLYLREKGLQYLYGGRVAEFIRYMGIARSTDFDDTRRPAEVNRKLNAKNPIGLTVGGKSTVRKNVFNNQLGVGDNLFFVLKKSSQYGPFQIFPFSSGQKAPTREDISYVDLSGEIAYGVIFYTGRLLSGIGNMNFDSHESRELATGLTSDNPREAYDQMGRLGIFESIVKSDYITYAR